MVTQILSHIAKLATPAGTQTNQVNAEIETQPVNVEVRINKCST